jgi:hypothetical protein
VFSPKIYLNLTWESRSGTSFVNRIFTDITKLSKRSDWIRVGHNPKACLYKKMEIWIQAWTERRKTYEDLF